MPSIDQRVVGMSFDNANFEQKVSATLKSLDQLQKTLDFTNSQKGLSELSKSAKSFSMGDMASAVEGVSAKFLALSTIGITVLSNLTNRAVDAGMRMVKSLGFEQVMSGFQEYELGMKSIQTILSNTRADGTNLQQVNAALDELNTYADKTIYNFGEMTRNIGTFTAAGVNLGTSVQSIKGIANLAAISGSNSQQASTAMYQLSQAISTGTLRLQDWNSVVNAGMGGEVFQKALFETGKAMKTIENVDLGTTFEEWTSNGNSFRGSLEQNWLTADVLTTTLQGFTGEMTEAQLTAIGYTKEQAAEIIELGEIGVEAATKVRTLTQLIDTTKEAIGSGWSESFRTVFGNFEQATELFTGISNAVGEMVENSSKARNDLLKRWAFFGGRNTLIEGLKNGFLALGDVIKPIKEAFREVFPPMTALRLINLTNAFADFTKALRPSEETIDKIKRIALGFFSAIQIGIEIIKGFVSVIFDLIGSLSGAGSGAFDWLAGVGDSLTALNDKLVEGGKIKDFFSDVSEYLKTAAKYVVEFKDGVIELFKNFKVNKFDGISVSLDRFKNRFSGLTKVFDKLQQLWDPLARALGKIGDILGATWDVIHDWFSNLGRNMAEASGTGDFSAVLDLVNVGLLGGIAALIGKFLKGGFNFDLGDGLFEKIGGSFDQLTSTMSAMQTQIKAEALMKIAVAIGILTASVLVLSTIDSKALSKSMAALAVGFGQLVGAFAIINQIASGPKGASSFTLIAGGLIALSAAILILSLAVKVLATMSWEEMARGLVGVVALLGSVVAVSYLLSKNTSGLIRAGIGMIGIAIALNILAGAVKIFATMSWEEMGRGLAGVAGSLIAVAAAMQLMPKGSVLKGAGLIEVAIALNILALAVKQFAGMDYAELGRGFVGIGGGLLIIAAAMNLMPATMPLIGAGLLMVSASLLIIGKALKNLSGMSWEEMGKGLAGLAGSLLILALATTAMSGTLGGALAIAVVSASLLLLVEVLRQFAALSWGDLIKGMVGMAGVFLVLGLAGLALGPIIPVLLGLGAALIILGAGFALFGAGAILVAKSFEIFAKAGKAGLGLFIAMIDELIIKLPAMVAAFAEGLVQLATTLLAAAPVLLEQFGVLLGQIMQTLLDLLPQFGELLSGVISMVLTLIREKIPEFVETGFAVLMALLQGIRDNIGEITTAVIDIILTFTTALGERVEELVAAGLTLLTNFLSGIADNIGNVISSVGEIITSFITAVGDLATDIAAAGTDALVDFLTGMTDNFEKVIGVVGLMITTFITEVANLATDIATAGTDALVDFLNGIGDNLVKVTNSAGDVIAEFITAIGNKAGDIATAGTDALIDFIEGIGDNLDKAITAGVDVVISFIEGIGKNTLKLARAAADVIIDFVNGLADTIDEKAPELRDAGWNLAKAIIDGAVGGLDDLAGTLKNKATSVFKGVVNTGLSIFGINSPSKVFRAIGQGLIEGLVLGVEEDGHYANQSVQSLGESVTSTAQKSFEQISTAFADLVNIDPTITPVLDLTYLNRDAKTINGLLGSTVGLDFGYSTARSISAETSINSNVPSTTTTGTNTVTFEQNIYSPTALTTNDIYRNTRNQISLAREELSIPA